MTNSDKNHMQKNVESSDLAIVWENDSDSHAFDKNAASPTARGHSVSAAGSSFHRQLSVLAVLRSLLAHRWYVLAYR